MLNFFQFIWPYLIGAVTCGPAAWLATEFVARPFQRFLDLRNQIKRSMILLWDAPIYGMQEDSDEWVKEMAPFKEQRDDLARLAAEISAFAQSGSFAIWIVRMLRYDLLGAGTAARKLALELGTNVEDRDVNYRRLDATLKFKFDPRRSFYNPYHP